MPRPLTLEVESLPFLTVLLLLSLTFSVVMLPVSVNAPLILSRFVPMVTVPPPVCPVSTIVGPLVPRTETVSLPPPVLSVVVVPLAVEAMVKVLPLLPRVMFNALNFL